MAYSITAEGPDGEAMYLGESLTYLGELTLEWSSHEIHVFREGDGALLGLRPQDVATANPSV